MVDENEWRDSRVINPRVFVGIVAELSLLTALILIPPFRAVFNTAASSFSEWGALLALPPLMCWRWKKDGSG